jgi:phage terminase small subunit
MAAKKDQPGLENDWRLTPKQALFVVEYLKDLNATQAAIRAGYSADTAQKNAHRLMAIEGVKQAIAAGTAKQLEAAELSAARVLEEYRRVAFANIQDFHDSEGNLKAISELTREQASALAGVEILKRNLTAGDGVLDTVYKIKLWDKLKALQDLAKYFGLLVEKVEVSGELSMVEARLLAGRKRVAALKGAE